jgi:hypothetical protein
MEATVIALQDIKEGDELMLNYIDGESEANNWDFEQEQKHLRYNYGIDCSLTCSCGKFEPT